MNIQKLLHQEHQRQIQEVCLIASENYVSAEVRECLSSFLTNKYAEGYPGNRYYAGCRIVDEIETQAIESASKLFGCQYANVQPHSGSQANQAVLLALLQPGDRILGMDLSAGGHLTHGSPVNLSGKWFECHTYGVDESGLLDYTRIRDTARKVRPNLIIAGASAYSGLIDWSEFRRIADEVGAWLLVDIAHYAGLIAAGHYPNPFPFAHIVTSTTHKTLRGPRGGLILTDCPDLNKLINSAVFPGLQGGPLLHVIAAKAVCFQSAGTQEFRDYISQVLTNCRVLVEHLPFPTIGDIRSHLALLDVRNFGSGREISTRLERSGIIVNPNTIPGDLRPRNPSGIRIGTPAVTTRGFREPDIITLSKLIMSALDGDVSEEVRSLAGRHLTNL